MDNPCVKKIALLITVLFLGMVFVCEAGSSSIGVVEVVKLYASDGENSDLFGASVAIDGDVIVVGAQEHDLSGATYVYRYNQSTSAWDETKLTASDGAANDLFGASVALDGDVVVVGAVGDDDLGQSSGSAYVYRYNPSTSAWDETKLTASDGAANDLFGASVALDGDVVVVGVPGNDNRPGSAYVYRYNPSTSAWAEIKLTASDGVSYGRFGQSVAIDGDVVVVGAPEVAGDQPGSTYVYRYNPSTSAWEETKLRASDGEADDLFGRSVAIDGDVVVVGAPIDDDLGFYSGSAYVYRYNPSTSAWDETKLTATDGAEHDRFGHSVAIDGEVVVVGAPRWGAMVLRPGSAYVYRYNLSTSAWEETKLTASDAAGEDLFGASVPIDGDVVVVGAAVGDTPLDSSGCAYVYMLYEVGLEGPLTGDLSIHPNPAALGTIVRIAGTVDDSTTGETPINLAEYRVDAGDFSPMLPMDGLFDSVVESVYANTSFTEAGVYNVCVRGWVAHGNISGPGPEECLFLPVYDPSSGFVTGGGWITSPPGAYVPDAELNGKATFGFVSKYKRGANRPTGVTEFKFKVADLNFHSDWYEWLVMAGARAQFKGMGTINEEGEYHFMISAIDGALIGGDDIDKFRIKIWETDEWGEDQIIYDNQLGEIDDAEPATEIGGGSIVIHRAK